MTRNEDIPFYLHQRVVAKRPLAVYLTGQSKGDKHNFSHPCQVCGRKTITTSLWLLSEFEVQCSRCAPPASRELQQVVYDKIGHTQRARSAYSMTHQYFNFRHGRAACYKCSKCEAMANSYAYNNSSPDELLEVAVDKKWMGVRRYSLNITDYTPLCKECHNEVDEQWREKMKIMKLYGQVLARTMTKEAISSSPANVSI